MKISMYNMAIDTFVPMLQDLSAVLDKGAEYSRIRFFDLPNARLAPDMFTLTQQVQLACSHAADGVARLVGEKLRHFENDEKTTDHLKIRIKETVEHLGRTTPAAFADAEDRDCSIFLPKDKVIAMNGLQFLRDWALPHFYFHVVMTYAILRHCGVVMGKEDYLDHIGGYIHPGRP
jgi:hypothetical protein